jgi:hypothetical protein
MYARLPLVSSANGVTAAVLCQAEKAKVVTFFVVNKK